MLLPNNKGFAGFQRVNFYFKTSYVITKQGEIRSGLPLLVYFKTSYVITKPIKGDKDQEDDAFQNIICYYQTQRTTGLRSGSPLFQNIICYYQTVWVWFIHILFVAFQNIICYYQTHGFKPSFNPLIPWKPLNHGILFKFYQPTPNFRNDS